MLKNAYFLAKIGAHTAENEQHFAEILPIGRRLHHGDADLRLLGREAGPPAGRRRPRPAAPGPARFFVPGRAARGDRQPPELDANANVLLLSTTCSSLLLLLLPEALVEGLLSARKCKSSTLAGSSSAVSKPSCAFK